MKKKSGLIRGVIVGVVLICLVGGYYYYLTNKREDKSKDETVEATVVQQVLMRNLDNNYPPTPREVVKYFGEIAQCMIGETYTDEDLEKLAFQVQRLYDAELIANKTQQQYLEDLKWDLNSFKEEEIVISSYSPSSGVDVEEFSRDGFKWARLYCNFSLRKGTQIENNEQVFLLRKDEDGHWKIYGWQPVENKAE